MPASGRTHGIILLVELKDIPGMAMISKSFEQVFFNPRTTALHLFKPGPIIFEGLLCRFLVGFRTPLALEGIVTEVDDRFYPVFW